MNSSVFYIILSFISQVVVTQEEDSKCDEGYECTTTRFCPSYVADRKKMLEYLETGDIENWNKTKTRLKSLICNKKLKKICCSCEKSEAYEENSPSYFPTINDWGCGVGGNNSAFIVGGENTSLQQYPWMVLLGRKQKSGTTKFICGGALINKW